MIIVPTRLQASPIHGLGLFALSDLSAGTVVWQDFGEWSLCSVTPEALAEAPVQVQRHFLYYAYLYEGSYLLCLDDARFMNHAAAANVRERPGGISVAARDIRAGEELTCDYREFDAAWRQKLPTG